jgi:hypothetical protein
MDRADKDTPQQLQTLSEDAAQLATTLARLARSEARHPSAGQGQPPLSTADVLRTIIEMRRLRARHIADALFTDPAWDMCLAADVPTTTALRWINEMCGRGLVFRAADSKDRRRVFVELTPPTEARIRAYLDAVGALLRVAR